MELFHFDLLRRGGGTVYRSNTAILPYIVEAIRTLLYPCGGAKPSHVHMSVVLLVLMTWRIPRGTGAYISIAGWISEVNSHEAEVDDTNTSNDAVDILLRARTL
jgi:hypothetical protein